MVLPPPVPAAPVGVSTVAGDNTITLGWSSVTYADSYSIYRSTASGNIGTKIASTGGVSYHADSVSNGMTYNYSVTASDSAGESVPSSEVSATPNAPAGPITIGGTVQYQDKEYDVSGFTGNQPYKAVRHATIELINATTSSVLYSTTTDLTGLYSIPTTTSTTAVYVRVKAEATLSGSDPQIMVNNLSGNLYAVGGNNFVPSGPANVNISVHTSSVGGAFNMLDVFTNGIQFVYSLSGTYSPVPLYGIWQTGNQNGTYYCNPTIGCPTDEIHVLNYAGDTDEYDDDVLYHEFGHFTAAHFSQDDSPGGPHMLTNNDLDMRLTWSEGWGDSMPGHVKMWLNSTNPGLLSSSGVPLTEHVDTYGSGAGIAIDMDNPGGYPYCYATGEVAIAKILLDTDQKYGMDKVWSVLSDFQANPPLTPTANLELFWDRWNSKGYPSLQSIFNNRLINYSDLYTSDTFSTATAYLNFPQVHRIYPDGDFDLVSFNTNTNKLYTVSTSILLNGADTYIEVYNQNKQQVAANDNGNGYSSSQYAVPSENLSLGLCDQYGICHDNRSDGLRSSKQFQALSTGPYFVKIYSSPNRPVSAGRYGSYMLTITSP